MSFSAPSGGLWSAEDTPSNARLNRKEFFIGTGQEISGISPTYPGMPVFCVLDGAGLVGGYAYARSPDNQSWIPLGLRRHLHDDDTEQSGGKLIDILDANIETLFWNNKPTFKVASSVQLNAGGTIFDDPDFGASIMSTSNIAGNWAEFRDTGAQFDYGSSMKMIWKCYVDNNSYTTVKVGTGMELMSADNDTNKKLGFEFCDTIGTPRNWEVTSADGVQRSTSTTTQTAKAATPNGFKLIFTPFQTLQFYVGGVLNTTKSINIPNSGSSENNNLAGVGIRTNNTLEKHFFLYGYSMLGNRGDGNAWA